MNVARARRVLRISAAVGAAIAGGFGARALEGPWTLLAEALLVTGACVVVPLGTAIALPPDRRARRGAWAALAFVVPLGGVCAAASLLLPHGAAAIALACGFLASCLACALLGVARLLAWGSAPREELVVDVGLLSLVVAGVWLVIDRTGRPFMGFAGPIVLMTAVHFVFAGFAASLIAGLAGRVTRAARGWRRVWGAAALVVAAGPALVGIGITASPLVEAASALLLALGMLALGVVLVTLPIAGARAAVVRALLVVSSGSLVVTMAFAAAFALRRSWPDAAPSWERMAHFHGMLNALGFALCGVLAMTLLDAHGALAVRAPRFGVPFSRFRATWRVTDAFFAQRGLVDAARPAPAGLVEDLAVFARPGLLDPSALDDDVRAFYEQTAQHTLLVRPHWQPGWRRGGRLFRALMRPIGQLGLPVDAARDDEMDSRLLAVDEGADGRAAQGARGGVRAWVRNYAQGGDTVYAAAYTVHAENAVPYMNIAFPLPSSNMTSVLRMDPLAAHMGVSALADGGRGGLALTTRPPVDPRGRTRAGDEGVYLATRAGALRLPLDETITVWSARHGDAGVAPLAAARGATVLAQHTMWLWGMRFLVLDYFLVPVPADAVRAPPVPRERARRPRAPNDGTGSLNG